MAAAPERSRRRTNHRRRAQRGGSERNLIAARTPSQFGFRKEAFVTSGLIHAQMVVCHAKPSKISRGVLKNDKAYSPCHPLGIYKFVQTLHLRLPVPAPFVARNSTTPRYPSLCFAGELPDKVRIRLLSKMPPAAMQNQRDLKDISRTNHRYINVM